MGRSYKCTHTKNALQCIAINMNRIAIYPQCIRIDALCLHITVVDLPALTLVCMTDSAVCRRINALRIGPRYTEVLTLGRLPPQPDQDTASGDQSGPSTNQPAPSTSSAASAPGTGSAPQPSTSSPQPRQPTEEELAQDAIGQKVLNATMCSATEVDGKTPPFNSSLRQVDLQFNQEYGYSTMEGIIRCLDYRELNGGFVPLSTQQRGACLLHAFRRSIVCPRELTNTHLRRMVVRFICQHLDYLYPMLRLSIAGNYGHIKLFREQYEDLRARDLLTPQQREDYNEPGPFSVIVYLENLLKPNSYGEETVLRVLSMLFQVQISVLNSNTFLPIKVRHANKTLKADVVLVHIDRHHYIPLGNINSIFQLKLLCIVHCN